MLVLVVADHTLPRLEVCYERPTNFYIPVNVASTRNRFIVSFKIETPNQYIVLRASALQDHFVGRARGSGDEGEDEEKIVG